MSTIHFQLLSLYSPRNSNSLYSHSKVIEDKSITNVCTHIMLPTNGSYSRHFFPQPFRVDNYDEYAPVSPPASISGSEYDPASDVETIASYAEPHNDGEEEGEGEERPKPPQLSPRAQRRFEEKLRKQRYESVQRLKSSWELLLEKYGDINPEEDDEIDIFTGKVIVNRGRLRKLIPRDFGEAPDDDYDDWDEEDGQGGDDEEEQAEGVEGEQTEDGEEEDEEAGTPPPVLPARTVEDERDLEEFTRLENERRAAAGEGALEVALDEPPAFKGDPNTAAAILKRQRAMLKATVPLLAGMESDEDTSTATGDDPSSFSHGTARSDDEVVN